MNTLNLYAKMIWASFRGQMQYKASFIMLSLGNMLASVVDFVGIWALFDRFGQLEGWTLAEVAVFFGLINVSFAIAEGWGRGFDMFARLIRTGAFDRMLLRPRGAAFQVLASEFQLTRVGRLMQGAVILGIGVAHLGYAWGVMQYTVLLMSILTGVCLFFSLLMIQAAICFWTIDPPEVFNVLTYGGITALSYPISIYRAWMRSFFTFVIPLAAINYLPAAILFGKNTGWPPELAYMSPLIGLLFLALGRAALGAGMRRYASTGS